MNVARFFEEDGFIKLLVKVGHDGWPRVKRFSSFSEMLQDLQWIGLEMGELAYLCARGLENGKPVELPGSPSHWESYFSQA